MGVASSEDGDEGEEFGKLAKTMEIEEDKASTKESGELVEDNGYDEFLKEVICKP